MRVLIPSVAAVAVGVLAYQFGGSTSNSLGTTSAEAANPKAAVKTLNNSNSATNADKVISVAAVGDVMIGSSFPSTGYLPDDDAQGSFREVKPYLKGDIVFGNLEGTLLDDGPSAKCPTVSTSCYAFRMPERYANIIKDAGFNLMSVANNHIGDFGDLGRQRTLQTLAKVGIEHAGLQQKPTAIFEKNGVRYGFVAFAPNLGTVPLNDLAGAASLVRDLKQKVDIVIVSFHGGAEGATHTHVPKTSEIFLGENRGDVYKFAHTVVDAGADLVIGQGPHVTRAVELYNHKFIAYSLGNFNTYGAFNLKGPNGYAPLMTIKLRGNGDFIGADVTSVKQTKEARLQLDPSNQAFTALKDLTQSDFPTTPLTFQNNHISVR